MSAVTPLSCACPGCSWATAEHPTIEQDGKTWCSQACADHHPAGQSCPNDDCHCEQGTQVQERTVTEPQLDAAVEETFPASDPISP